MRRDSKLSSILHVLLHMAHGDRPFTSEELAGFLGTNPVLVRRVLAGLRERGYVGSDKGHGGGWSITCDLRKVTLYDIYEALGDEHPQCLVERAVNEALGSAFDEAEALLISRFRNVTLAQLSASFNTHHKGVHHEHR